MTRDFIVTSRALQAKGFCVSGVRAWMGGHAIDFKDFLKNGIAASRLLETGDALGVKAVELLEADLGKE